MRCNTPQPVIRLYISRLLEGYGYIFAGWLAMPLLYATHITLDICLLAGFGFLSPSGGTMYITASQLALRSNTLASSRIPLDTQPVDWLDVSV